MDAVADLPAVYAEAGIFRRVRVTAVGRPLQRLAVAADLVVAKRPRTIESPRSLDCDVMLPINRTMDAA